MLAPAGEWLRSVAGKITLMLMILILMKILIHMTYGRHMLMRIVARNGKDDDLDDMMILEIKMMIMMIVTNIGDSHFK